MVQGDEARVYRELGRRIGEAKQAGCDEFVACALDMESRTIGNNALFVQQLLLRTHTLGPEVYADHLEEHCIPSLQGLDTAFAVLIAPPGLLQRFNELAVRARGLQAAAVRWVAYLRKPVLTPAGERKEAMALARAWYEFLHLHAQTRSELRGKLTGAQPSP